MVDMFLKLFSFMVNTSLKTKMNEKLVRLIRPYAAIH